MGLLKQLPPSPDGQKGWPWTEETDPYLPDSPDKSKVWPKITIVTPSFNQGEFIEETIRSILLQNYPNIEYIIIDGGSTDNSVEIIKKYEPWLTHWVSEKDNGQSHAINKGLSRATGDILAWLNSDDLFRPGALSTVAETLPIDDIGWMIGATKFIDKVGNQLSIRYPVTLENHYEMFINWSVLWFPQPSTFWNAMLFSKVGLLDESLSYVMDVDYWYRLISETNPKTINYVVSTYRCHEQTKTIVNDDQSQKELLRWVNLNIFFPNEDLEKKIAFTLSELRKIQNRNQQLENINNHIVIGKFIKLWKKFINPDLDI